MDHFCDNLRKENFTSCCDKRSGRVKFCQCCCAFCCCLALCRGRAFAASHIPINWTEAAGENIQEHVHVRGERNKKDVPLEQSGVKADYLNKRADLGPLGNVKLAKTPFSLMTTSHDIIQNQQIRNMNETTEYMPSVQVVALSDPAQTRYVNRGYESDTISNSRMDGMNVFLSAPYTTEEFDHVDVLNGAAGSIYGPENPAGVVNMVLKRPTARPYFNFNFGYDSNGSPLESLDTSLGKGPIKVRFNYVNQTGQSYVSTSNQWRNLYSGNIDFQIAKHTKLELDAAQYNAGFYGYPGYFTFKNGVNNLPDAPNLSVAGYGQAQSGDNLSSSLGQAKLIQELSPHWRIKLGGSYEDYARYVRTTANNILGEEACAKAGISGPCYKQNIAIPTNGQNFSIWSNMAYLNGEFHTGFIKHHVNLGSNGYAVSSQAPDWVDKTESTGIRGFYDPQVIAGSQLKKGGSHQQNKTSQQTILFGDNMDFGRYVSVMGQFAFGWIEEQNYSKKGERKSIHTTNGAFSPTVTLALHPTENFNAYFNWATSVQAGPEAPAGSLNSGEILPIITTQQFEGGIKYTWKGMQINLDGFGMSRPYAYDMEGVKGPGNPKGKPIYGLFGSQNDSGVEFQVSGAVGRELSVMGGVTWLNPLAQNTGNSKTDNKQIVGVPPWATDFLFDWHPKYMHGVAFNTNIHYNSKRAANVFNTAWASEYVTLDLGVRYSTKLCDHQLVFRGGVNNVTDENYWSSVFSKSSAGAVQGASNVAVAGAPRTWHITASVYF